MVIEDTSYLLEVEVETRDEADVSYQWLKNDIPLGECKEFIGVRMPVLQFYATSLSVGTYTCAVELHDNTDSSVSSEPIVVSISDPPLMKTLSKILVDRYCAQPAIPKDSWPPHSSNTYINLALINQGHIEKAGEYARYTVQGNMDDIVADKESIEYDAVFKDLKSGGRF